MACPAMAPHANGEPGHPMTGSTYAPDGDEDRLLNLRASLQGHSGDVDPLPSLAETRDHFDNLHTPRLRSFLGKYPVSGADRVDCFQDPSFSGAFP